MKIEILVATMYEKDYSVPKRLNIQGSALVINQTDFKKFPNISGEFGKIKFISNDKRGLSRSRNLALENSTAEICVIADQDVKYIDNYENIIKNAYLRYPDADVILFDFYKPNNSLSKTIKKGGGKLTLLQSLRGNSVRVSFKRKSIINNGISYNECFGSGSGKFIASEDLVFITDCQKNKLQIYYEPVPILSLVESKSTWFKGYNKDYFETIGAFSYHLMGNLWFLYAIQFLLRHRKLYNINAVFKNFQFIRSGVIKYKAIK